MFTMIDRFTFLDGSVTINSRWSKPESDFTVIFDTIGLAELRIWYSLQNSLQCAIFHIVLTILPLIVGRYLPIAAFSIFTNFFKFDFNPRDSSRACKQRYLFLLSVSRRRCSTSKFRVYLHETDLREIYTANNYRLTERLLLSAASLRY